MCTRERHHRTERRDSRATRKGMNRPRRIRLVSRWTSLWRWRLASTCDGQSCMRLIVRLLQRSVRACERALRRRDRVAHALDLVVREALAEQLLHDLVRLLFAQELVPQARARQSVSRVRVVSLSVKELQSGRSYLNAQRHERDEHRRGEDPDPSRRLVPRLSVAADASACVSFERVAGTWSNRTSSRRSSCKRRRTHRLRKVETALDWTRLANARRQVREQRLVCRCHRVHLHDSQSITRLSIIVTQKHSDAHDAVTIAASVVCV